MNNFLLNCLPLAVVAVALLLVARAGRAPLWVEAFRRMRRNRLAMISLGVLSIYALVALADSVGWSDQGGDRRTVIDRLFVRDNEVTYSPPLGTQTVGEPKPRKLVGRHLLGTDGTGEDVLYRALKGCRTALIIGGGTSLLVTPLALLFGMPAGYFGKRVDDAVQYSYTVLDSIPGTLLMVALLMVLGRGLPQLCFALGVTSWVHLCRVARGETLKHRDREYVRAARALGLSDSYILVRHIFPNLLPIVIISVTLGFSSLVLQETILSYLGLGVGDETGSWGNMIDAARLELSREPVVWWNLAAASVALFGLVLAFNILADALRDAIDPRLRS